MKVTFLGTGTMINKRAAASIHVQTDKSILLDFGPRSIVNLDSAIDKDSIDSIFITHPHVDHYGEFIVYSFDKSWRELEGELKVFCPPGLKQTLENILKFPITELAKYETEIKEIINEEVFVGKTKVICKEVPHDPRLKALAYRVEYGDKSIVYSGDCGPCDELVEIAKDADAAIFEAARANPEKPHMTPQQAGEMAEKAGIRKLILTHFAPETDVLDVVTLAKENFSGEVIKAEDLMEVEV
jgi:ribonuclease BN (tRNA processing enzyme)